MCFIIRCVRASEKCFSKTISSNLCGVFFAKFLQICLFSKTIIRNIFVFCEYCKCFVCCFTEFPFVSKTRFGSVHIRQKNVQCDCEKFVCALNQQNRREISPTKNETSSQQLRKSEMKKSAKYLVHIYSEIKTFLTKNSHLKFAQNVE